MVGFSWLVFSIAGCFSKMKTLRLGKKVIASCFTRLRLPHRLLRVLMPRVTILLLFLKRFLDQQPKEHLAGMPRIPSLNTFSLGQMPGEPYAPRNHLPLPVLLLPAPLSSSWIVTGLVPKHPSPRELWVSLVLEHL